MITLATWNINSVRLRLTNVERFLRAERPDILLLQEIKTEPRHFPREAFAALGYPHCAVYGQKGYHGVATISRLPFSKAEEMVLGGRSEARFLMTELENGFEIHNAYVPAGGDIPDRAQNDKFGHKLDFLADLAAFYGRQRGKRTRRLVLGGDLNVAPREHDVWSHKQLLDVVSHTPVEVEHLGTLQSALDFIDVTREAIPEPEKVYTWWSYRAADWRASDRGRRLDHLWVSPALSGGWRNIRILKEWRDGDKPSDHVPLLAEIEEA